MAVDAGAPAPKQGLSTGAKVLLGCAVALVVGFGILAVAVGVGGFALKRGVESAVGSLDEQREASETLARLEEEHPFQVPEEGEVGEARLERFLAVTQRAWDDMEEWAEDLEELSDRDTQDRPGLRDMVSGARALGGMVQARIQLAEALAEEEMSLGEYVWTGLSLSRAVDVVEGGGDDAAAPEENLRLVERHGERLPRFDDERPGPGTVLAVATVWGMADLSTWQAMGLDTLRPR